MPGGNIVTDLESFKQLFNNLGITYEEATLINGNIELDIDDESMAHGCELSIQFYEDGNFKMFVTS